MKALKYFTIALLSICMVSCSEKKSEEIVLTPSSSEVSGDLSDCFTVDYRDYKVTKNSLYDIVTIEIERTDKDLPFELGDRELCSFSSHLFAANVQVGFGIEFLDEDGNIVDKVSADGSGTSGSYDTDEAVALCKLKSGQKGTIRFTIHEEAKNAVSFRISSAYKENKESESNLTTTEDNSDLSSDEISDNDFDEDDELDEDDDNDTGSEDWNALLKSYEQYVDKYIALMKKASNGDMSAMAEYASLLSKAQDLSKKMEKAKGQMSVSQWEKYNKITMKMAKAIKESN